MLTQHIKFGFSSGFQVSAFIKPDAEVFDKRFEHHQIQSAEALNLAFSDFTLACNFAE